MNASTFAIAIYIIATSGGIAAEKVTDSPFARKLSAESRSSVTSLANANTSRQSMSRRTRGLAGTWTGTAGGVATLINKHKGTLAVPGVCSALYKLEIYNYFNGGFDVNATYEGIGGDCVYRFAETQTFKNGSCHETDGILVDDNGTYKDNWKKSAAFKQSMFPDVAILKNIR